MTSKVTAVRSGLARASGILSAGQTDQVRGHVSEMVLALPELDTVRADFEDIVDALEYGRDYLHGFLEPDEVCDCLICKVLA